jgi:hypothetical protein
MQHGLFVDENYRYKFTELGWVIPGIYKYYGYYFLFNGVSHFLTSIKHMKDRNMLHIQALWWPNGSQRILDAKISVEGWKRLIRFDECSTFTTVTET